MNFFAGLSKDSFKTIMDLLFIQFATAPNGKKTSFLNGLFEKVYMSQIEGFEVEDKEHMVCKTEKSLYGRKEASRYWFIRFDHIVTSFGFQRKCCGSMCINQCQ